MAGQRQPSERTISCSWPLSTDWGHYYDLNEQHNHHTPQPSSPRNLLNAQPITPHLEYPTQSFQCYPSFYLFYTVLTQGHFILDRSNVTEAFEVSRNLFNRPYVPQDKGAARHVPISKKKVMCLESTNEQSGRQATVSPELSENRRNQVQDQQEQQVPRSSFFF